MFQFMRYVYEVYKEMSFSRAARNLFISQPSLSTAVKKEEERIGHPIFDRSTNPIKLTEIGQAYIRSVEKILETENSFKNYVNDLENLKNGTLFIGGTNFFVSYVLPPLLSRFSGRYPMVQTQLIEASTEELKEKLNAGILDLILDNSTLDEEIYGRTIIQEEHLLLAVPKEFSSNSKAADYALTAGDVKEGRHLETEMKAVPIRLFQDEPFLLLREGNDTRERAVHICKAARFVPGIRLELDQQITAYNLACHGMGISFVGDSLIRNVPDTDSLLFYKLDNQDSVRQISFYYRKNRYCPKAMEVFLEMIDCG